MNHKQLAAPLRILRDAVTMPTEFIPGALYDKVMSVPSSYGEAPALCFELDELLALRDVITNREFPQSAEAAATVRQINCLLANNHKGI